MRFVGLRRNDAAREQYQLWIFDGRRDQRYPVDGGVFDADGRDEIVVPIRARLPVGTPLAFAVTLERAGGVVVSDRERVVVIARSS
jgi:anti-sigma-K factor RskA